MSTARHQPGEVWGLDADEYRRHCRFLGLTPGSDTLRERISRHLGDVASRTPVVLGFSRFLASRQSGIVELWLLDVWTRLWMPEHPLRHKLNAVIAVHECDAVGYAELSRSVLPTWVWLSLVATRYVIALGLTFIWVGGLYCCYRVRTWLPG